MRDLKTIIEENKHLIEGLANCHLTIQDESEPLPEGEWITTNITGYPAKLSMKIDKELSQERIEKNNEERLKNIKHIEKLIEESDEKLQNENFINKANPKIVEAEKLKNENLKQQLKML